LNVGAIFRTAECAGVSKIFITGYTPSPKDRFGRVRKDMAKSALGAENLISWEKREINELLTDLEKNGIEIISIEQNKNSIDYKKYKTSKSTAFILGNEVEGIPKEILNTSDKIIEVYVKGRKESLNVSTTLGIVLFRILDI
jgi:tRNA G18 (ribose-2'-O)-methylase SpoU